MQKYILEFQGEYRWLSNFWEADMVMNLADLPKGIPYSAFSNDLTNLTFPSNEHWYQINKCRTDDEDSKDYIFESATPAIAKQRAKEITVRPDWDSIKLKIMEVGLRAKFGQHQDLRQKLTATNPMILYEGNRWNDRFWGVVLDRQTGKLVFDGNGKPLGKNQLGELLMTLRQEYLQPKSTP